MVQHRDPPSVPWRRRQRRAIDRWWEFDFRWNLLLIAVPAALAYNLLGHATWSLAWFGGIVVLICWILANALVVVYYLRPTPQRAAARRLHAEQNKTDDRVRYSRTDEG